MSSKGKLILGLYVILSCVILVFAFSAALSEQQNVDKKSNVSMTINDDGYVIYTVTEPDGSEITFFSATSVELLTGDCGAYGTLHKRVCYAH